MLLAASRSAFSKARNQTLLGEVFHPVCFILEIILTVYGIVVLVTGKIALGGGRHCYGTPARLAGAIFAATLPLALVGGLLFGFAMGANAAAKNQQLDMNQIIMFGAVIDIGVVLLCLLGGLGVAYANGEPTRKPKLGLEEGYDEKYIRPRRGRVEPDEPRRDDYTAPPDDRVQE
jgi:hypothetical protein